VKEAVALLERMVKIEEQILAEDHLDQQSPEAWLEYFEDETRELGTL
jgi:hypothetical protein